MVLLQLVVETKCRIDNWREGRRVVEEEAFRPLLSKSVVEYSA